MITNEEVVKRQVELINTNSIVKKKLPHRQWKKEIRKEC